MDEIILNRIKYYRNLLGITQKELACEKITSNYIYMLESGRRKLSITIASILASNFNEIASKKGILLNLTAEDLLEDQKAILNNHYMKHFYYLQEKEFCMDEYGDLFKKALEHDLSEVIVAVGKDIGECEYEKSNYSSAIKYLTIALERIELLKEPITEINILNRIGTSHYMLGEYKSAIKFLEKAWAKLEINNIEDPELNGRVLFNIALSYTELKAYEESLVYIERISNIKGINKKEFIKSVVLKANIYHKMSQHRRALDIYEAMEKSEKDYLVYYNMSIISNSLSMYDDSLKYLNLSIELQSRNESELTTNTLIHLSDLYAAKSLFRQALVCIERALVCAKRYDQIDKQIKCFSIILELQKKLLMVNEFDYYAEYILENLDMYIGDKQNIAKILLLLFQYTNEVTKSELGFKILSKIKERI